MERPHLVTAALPYANGPLHFGHVAGAYLPADIYVRYLRLRRRDVLFVCGTDEHGVAITMKAEQEGKGYQEYVDHWHAVIRGVFERLDIRFDIFSQTSHRDPHYPLSQEFFLRLLENRRVEPHRVHQHYCTHCERFLPDRFVTGTCYLCGAEGARGDECKRCGQWLDATRLVEPRCARCGNPPEIRETMQYELQLAGFEKDPAVAPWYRRFTASQKPNVRTFVVNKMVEGEGLKARPITRDLPWGVPVPRATLRGEPIAEVEDKVLYVWFDAPIGYISATIEWARAQGDPGRWRRYWICRTGEEGPRLVHFIGKDNIPFHCIVFPAMLAWQALEAKAHAAIRQPLQGPGPGERYVLPEAVPANEFYNLENRKFSTSDGWYIDMEDVFERYSATQLRHYLACSLPETGDSNFLWAEFQSRTNELADTFGNLASRVVRFVQRYRDGKVPASATNRLLDLVRGEIERVRDELAAALETFQFRRATAAYLDLCRYGNKLLDEEKPWSTRTSDPARCDEALAACLFLLRALVPLTAPFIPAAASDLAAMLGLPSAEALEWEAMTRPLPTGHELGEARVLVPKIEDAQVAAERERLHAG